MSPSNSMPNGNLSSSSTGSDSSDSSVAAGPAANTATFQSPMWPTNIPLTEKYMSDPTWLADLILDCKKGNWEEWSSCITILAKRQGFLHWLNGSFLAPLEADDAARHFT
jgi:hypothetical protein